VRLHVIVPTGFEDPSRPSGGNSYDRRVCAGLRAAGWDVRIRTVSPPSPPGAGSGRSGTHEELTRVLTAIPEGQVVLIDGLIASPAAAELLPHAPRLRLVVLLHMPLATAPDEHRGGAALRSERAVLRAVDGVIVTSAWARRLLLARYGLSAERVRLAHPGTDHLDGAPPVASATGGGRLLSVGVVSTHKGQDLLVEALTRLTDLDWHCELVGALDRFPGFVQQLRSHIGDAGLGARVRLAGVLTGPELRRAYGAADLFLAPSRTESYGMAVTEALAFGLPVIAADVGGLPEALGCAPDGSRPGRIVPPHDPEAVAGALREWLCEADQRRRLRAAAIGRWATLPRWEQTTRDVVAALRLAGAR
jgi:glycosyltransferase involved in cell wall biosynthesis